MDLNANEIIKQSGNAFALKTQAAKDGFYSKIEWCQDAQRELVYKQFQSNFKRKFPFRAQVSRHNVWYKSSDTTLDFNSNIILNYAPLSAPEVKTELSNGGFMLQYVADKCGGKTTNFVVAEVFRRYVIWDCLHVKNYYFYGGIGVGKTTLLTEIARMLVGILAIDVFYITMPQLNKLLTSISDNDKLWLSEIAQCSFLFVDDIGQEKYTTDNQESLMRDFFVARCGNLLPTFFAGNIDIKDKQQGVFYKQFSDYLNDKTRFKVMQFGGSSRRN